MLLLFRNHGAGVALPLVVRGRMRTHGYDPTASSGYEHTSTSGYEPPHEQE